MPTQQRALPKMKKIWNPISTPDTGINRDAGSANAWLSFGLALVGGYADAASFILAKTFTGHITGSLVLATISVAEHDWRAMLAHVSAVLFFLVGIPLSILMERALAPRPSWRLLPTILGVEVILIAAAYFASVSQATRGRELFVICMSLALGLQNGAFRRTGGISVHTTYLTGTVTSLIGAQMDRLALRGTSVPATSPDPKFGLLWGIWAVFVLGAAIGAAAAFHFKERGILGSALILFAIIVRNFRVVLRSSPGS